MLKRMHKPLKVAFCGWMGSGKTDAAKHLKYNYGCEIISFADGIKYIDSYLFGTGKKNRTRLQKIGEFGRSLDSEIWVKRTMETIADEENVVVDDARRINEYFTLINDGFIILRIVADESVRVERLIERDGNCDTSLMYNDSETGMEHLILQEIKNNGTREEFYEKIDAAMLSLGYLKNNI